MSMNLFDPIADLTRFRSQLDHLLDDSAMTRESGRVWRPAVDLFEDENAFTVRMDLPGADPAQLDVQLTGEELVVRGERPWAAPEDATCLHSERVYGQFQRAFKLGVPVQSDAVEADFADGVLKVRIPKAESVKPRKVAVKSAA